MPIFLPNMLPQLGKQAIVRRVRAVFNDQARGQQPVVRSTDALFDPGSAIWRVHGDVTTMMVGGVAALLLQMLHPMVLAGVWDHSNFRQDMLGRLRRTARFIAITTYGARDDAMAAMARVRGIHEHVAGTLPDGRTYRASDPQLLAWVHVAEATSFLGAWQRYGDRRLSPTEEDRYFAEVAVVAEALGTDPVPHTLAAADRLIADMRGDLVSDARTRQVARLILQQRPDTLAAMPIMAVTFRAAVDILPRWAQGMHGLQPSGLARPLVDAGTAGIAGALRWAFR